MKRKQDEARVGSVHRTPIQRGVWVPEVGPRLTLKVLAAKETGRLEWVKIHVVRIRVDPLLRQAF